MSEVVTESNNVVKEIVNAEEEIQRHFFPDDKKINPWMFAMIGICCLFIAFVAFSIFKMCRSPPRNNSMRVVK